MAIAKNLSEHNLRTWGQVTRMAESRGARACVHGEYFSAASSNGKSRGRGHG